MEVSCLQAWVEDAERKVAEAAEEVAAAKTVALSEYQFLVEFERVCGENYDEVIRAFMYNVWCGHPEWDLPFLGEATKEMIAEFNALPETPLNDPPGEFVPLPDQSHRWLISPHRSSMKTLPRLMSKVVVELTRTVRWSKSTILLGS